MIAKLVFIKISYKVGINFESISELFEFPDVDWEEPKENLTAGLVCETPLDPVPAEPSPKIIGGKTVPIEHHPYIGKKKRRQ